MWMDEILKLIDITRKKGQRSIQLVNQNFRKKEVSKDNLLYEAVINGKYLSDEEAARDMFNTDPGNRNYRNTKGKLKQKLLNHLYFLDYDKEIYTHYQKTEYESLHALHQCKILIEENAGDIALRRLPQLIKTAKEFEFIDIAIDALVLMRNQFAKEGKSTSYNDINLELKHLKLFRDALMECEEMYYEVMAHINKSASAQTKIIDKITQYIGEIETRAREFSSNRLDILGKKLQLIYNNLNMRFDENIHLCNSLEKEYLQKPLDEINVDLNREELAFIKMYSLFFLKDIANGEKYAQKQLNIFRNGSEEWFSFIEYYFLLEISGERYKKAEEIFRMVRTNKNFNQLPEEIATRWQIYRAYMLLVNESKLLKWGFDSYEFINKIPDHPKHLVGYNIAILVIQFVYLLREGMVNDVKTRVKELEKYSSVHLDKRNNYRNSIFIRMLSIVTEKEFNYELIIEKAANYYRKLQKAAIPFDLKTELEVIPYEKLWSFILNILSTNKLYIHYRFYNPIE
jgi:hypothetical protein